MSPSVAIGAFPIWLSRYALFPPLHLSGPPLSCCAYGFRQAPLFFSETNRVWLFPPSVPGPFGTNRFFVFVLLRSRLPRFFLFGSVLFFSFGNPLLYYFRLSNRLFLTPISPIYPPSETNQSLVVALLGIGQFSLYKPTLFSAWMPR